MGKMTRPALGTADLYVVYRAAGKILFYMTLKTETVADILEQAGVFRLVAYMAGKAVALVNRKMDAGTVLRHWPVMAFKA